MQLANIRVELGYSYLHSLMDGVAFDLDRFKVVHYPLLIFLNITDVFATLDNIVVDKAFLIVETDDVFFSNIGLIALIIID